MYANTVTSPSRLIKGKVKGIGVETDFCGKLRKRHAPGSNDRCCFPVKRRPASVTKSRIRGIFHFVTLAITISTVLFTIDVRNVRFAYLRNMFEIYLHDQSKNK